MTNATTNVARVAAALAGFSLVAMSFGPLAAGAQTTTATTTTSATFTRNLTIGSTGADVTALQNWLIKGGYSIPAGATGYFGAQTKAALAAYQAANMITPAAGYFGPITRAKVMAGGDMGGSNGGGSSTGGLSGGEADLNDFDLASGDGEGDEGESGVELATAKFDVDGGDARIERVELTASSTDSSLDQRPWNYFDTISVYVDGKKVGDVDASDRDEWDEESTDDVYTITIPDLDVVVDEGDMAELTLMGDLSDSIDDADQDQEFDLSIMDEGIRAVDSEGIQQYTGDDNDTVSFGFGAEDNGDLTIRDSSDNPDSSVLKVEDDETSDEYTVFVFEARNSGDADAVITDLSIGTSLTGATSTADVIRRATLTVDGDDFDGDIADTNDGDISFDDIDVSVDADDTVTFELAVEFASQSNHFNSGDIISFSVDSADVDAEGADSGDELSGSDLSGSADSEDFTLSTTGFNVDATSATSSADNQDTASSSTGTFTIKFDVTADEDDPTFIDNVAANASTTASTTAGASYKVFRNGADASAAFTSENAVLTSTADMSGGAYRVDAGETETFTLTVTIDPAVSGLFAIELDAVNYAASASDASIAANNSTFDVDANDADFETDPVSINN